MGAYPLVMARFELSERWCGWTDLDVIFTAARAAIEAGPFDPPICEIVFNEEFDPLTVDTFEEAARAHEPRPGLLDGDHPVALRRGRGAR